MRAGQICFTVGYLKQKGLTFGKVFKLIKMEAILLHCKPIFWIGSQETEVAYFY